MNTVGIKKKLQNIKNFMIKNQTVILIIFTLLICYLSSIASGHYAEFFPINGTFQNFNPVRRILDGQIPYQDFVAYLGIGHLYTGTLFTSIFGGDYQASLIAFTFLTMLSFVLLSYSIGKVIINNKKHSIILTLALLLMIIINPLIFKNMLSLDDEFVTAFNQVLAVGNSARFIRSMILPIAILLFTLAYHKIDKSSLPIKKQNHLYLIATSIISGLSFIWSNDYGISVWVCTTIMYFIMMLKKHKKITISCLYTLLEMFASFIFIFIYISIFTKGHFLTWLTATFATGGYQSWYYNSSKSYYIFDIDSSFYIIVQILISIYYYYLYLKNNNDKNNLRYLLPAFANMTAFCATNEYKILSGNSISQYAILVLFVTLFFESVNLFMKYVSNNKKYIVNIVITAVIISGLSWSFGKINEEIKFKISPKEGIYLSELGGYNKTLAQDLINAQNFLKDKKIFATYSSALETITEQFQPTKYDYIIHVLGDNARKEYLNTFKTSNFDYVATIQRYYSEWELGWIERSNWYFYRELYSDYHPVYGNTYELFWEKNNNENYVVSKNNDINLSIERVTDQEVILHVDTDENISGIADVYLDYNVEKNDRLSSKFIFNRMLFISNYENVELVNQQDTDSNFLPSKSKEYVPVKIINGHGSIKLTSKPDYGTNLIINDAKCSRVLTVLFKYDQVESIKTIDGDLALVINNNLTTMSASENINEIIIDNQQIKVKKIIVDDNIYLVLDTKMSESEFYEILKKQNNVLLN